MLVLTARNVNEALCKGVALLSGPGTLRLAPRGAVTLEWWEPVCTVYAKPNERVLFSPARDANPFFHFFESLWMLAGRNDLAFVADLTKRMRQFSDDGATMQGAYGARWRSMFDFDQIEAIVELLRNDPVTRRAVLTMWSPNDLNTRLKSSDIPCNTHIYFKIRQKQLHMTVNCRSNDMVLGCYGANAVHFSILQEYIAGRVGAQLGTMRQVSDSFHVYTEERGGQMWLKLKDAARVKLLTDPYRQEMFTLCGLGAGDANWDADLQNFFNSFDLRKELEDGLFSTLFFSKVVLPLWSAFKNRDKSRLDNCLATDWAIAAREWLERREQ